MSGSFEFVPWNACVHRVDFGLYSPLKEFWGNGVRSLGKSPSTGGSEKGRTHESEPQHTTD